MAGQVLVAVFAAFGLLSAGWALASIWLPAQPATVMVHICSGREEAAVRRYRWLRNLGVLRKPLILVDSRLTQKERAMLCRSCPDVEFCDLAELPARMEQERKII